MPEFDPNSLNETEINFLKKAKKAGATSDQAFKYLQTKRQTTQTAEQPKQIEPEKNIFQKVGAGISESFKAGQERMSKGAELINNYGEAPKEAEQKGIGGFRQKVVGAGEAALGALETIASPVLGFVGAAAKDIGGDARKIIVNEVYQGQLESGKTPDEAAVETDRQFTELKQGIAKQLEPVQGFLEKYPEVGQAAELGLWLIGGGEGKAVAEVSEQTVKTGTKKLATGIGETGKALEFHGAKRQLVSEAEAVAKQVAKEETTLLNQVGTPKGIASRNKEIEEILTPSLTKTELAKIAEKQPKRIIEEGSILAQPKIGLDKIEKEAVGEVSKISRITNKKALSENAQVMKEEIATEAKQLAKDIKLNDAPITRAELEAVKKKTIEGLPTTIRGKPESYAERLYTVFEDIFNAKKVKTNSQLLEARKEFYKRIEQEIPKAFDTQGRALDISIRKMAGEMNNLIKTKAKGVLVEDSLKKQTLLFEGTRLVSKKIAENIIANSKPFLEKTLSFIANKAKASMILGTAVGSSAVVAVVTDVVGSLVLGAAGIATLYGSGKLLLKAGKYVFSPQTERSFGKFLQSVEKALTNPTLSAAQKTELMSLKSGADKLMNDFSAKQ